MHDPNDPTISSWIEVSQDSDFQIQNLPFGIFETNYCSPHGGVAIGEFILDLCILQEKDLLNGLKLPSDCFCKGNLNQFIGLGNARVGQVRKRISELLRIGNEELKGKDWIERALIPQKDAWMHLPIQVSEYTDFYSSEYHARNVGKLFRKGESPLLPNWKHMPVAYHGRASSIVSTGTDIRRPWGQVLNELGKPVYQPTAKLDFELEVAFIVNKPSELGQCISIEEARHHIVGMVLLNDWSARDIQSWEYRPLGPFLGKNFATSISPWIVTSDALTPFRENGLDQEPEVLPYLKSDRPNHFDVNLRASIRTALGNEAIVAQSNTKYLYWSIDQQLAHHTGNGCNVRVGDLMGSGTISGPKPGSLGCMLEASQNGLHPVQVGSEARAFLQDGDTITMHGFAEKNGVRVGFGQLKNTILVAHDY